MFIDEQWKKHYCQLTDLLGQKSFCFRKDGSEGHLVIASEHLGDPATIQSFYNNPEGVYVCGESKNFCKMIGPPDKIIALISRIFSTPTVAPQG